MTTGRTKPAPPADSAKLPRPTINTLDLTLDELDEASRLVGDGQCGYMASIAYVGLRNQGRKITVAEAKALTLRDVMIVDNADELVAEGASDPTT